MESTCAYCQANFTSERITKKYCSDTCKQMAYFIRNGLVLAGVNGNVPFNQKENKTDSVKYNDTKPLIVKQEISPTIENDAVKYDTLVLQQEFSVKPNFMEEQEIIVKPLCKSIAFNNATIVTKGSKNNCNPCESPIAKCDTTTEKNLSDGAAYFTLTENPKQEEELITEPTETANAHETYQPVNHPEPSHTETKNEIEQEKENMLHQTIKEREVDNILPETKKIIEQYKEDDIPYKWIESKLIYYIDNKYMNDKKALVLLNPFRHWSYEKVLHINWVNIRLRCLTESLIRLSNYSKIDTHTILCINDAFNRLVKSNAYKNLPDNYPYKELIAELALKTNEIAIKNRNETQLIFRLPVMRKAQLLTIRYQMLTNVPAIKFSELDFTEEGNLLKVIKPNEDGDEENDEETERPKTDLRRKLRAIKRERERNKSSLINN